jgi:hypothetical protein
MNWGGNQQGEAEKGEERGQHRRWERLGVDCETTRMEGNPGDGRQTVCSDPGLLITSVEHHVTLSL